MSTPVVRFAPSPTGYLHVGNVRQAITNWLFVLKQDGQFILRYDDTDQQRSTKEYADAIAADLAWLGITPHQTFRQSDRFQRYEEAASQLKQSGRLYPCYETTEELDFKRKRQLSQGKPPVYDRAALKLTSEQKQKFETEGRRPHWRFLLNDVPVEWNDLVRSQVKFESGHLSDPVLIREDGVPLYTFASVVDDLDYHITHVIRGEDHVANTAVQIQLAEALSGKTNPFTFAHLSLLTGAQGEGLSKRLGSLSIRDLAAQGIEPLALACLLAKLGTSDAIEPRSTMQALANEFDFAKFGRATPKFNPEELWTLNQKLLQQMPFSLAQPRLKTADLDYITEEFWNAIHGNITKLADLPTWWDVCFKPLTPIIQNAELTTKAAELLPNEPWTNDSWQTWISAVKSATGAAGKSLFLPLRLTLTTHEHGPELSALWQMMGYERVKARLLGKQA